MSTLPLLGVGGGSIPAFSYINRDHQTNDITTGNTRTFTSKSLGTPHSSRIIIVGVHSNFVTAVSVDSNPATSVVSNGTFSLWQVALASGSTGDIALTISGGTSTRAAIAWWAGYPASSTAVDSASDSAASTTNAVAVDLATSAGGFAVYFGGQASVVSTFTTTWGGADIVNADVGSYELTAEVASVTGGSFLTASTTTTNDLTLAASASGSKQLVCASWGAS